ncbi:double-strand break repair helicase AddA [Allorhizobium taibaishanense]|uniref:DNA 3'-5' helicase n=1 Tax=Allorhizobium taibaishanense TaxID=887144 RepID=A0A1Q9A2B8_9HYPH|nr:double-strand break repair helicase AddA [Allorhizobium taibaishanense]MBB4008963.1 ATP-dependent helicase/nuclease subunit A [Allorhizobium taibaishanense]OLP48717.1 double-strand break repair helicase AddA [Allorhizobium taibaishanense]
MTDPEILREGEDPIDWTTRQQSLASDPARSAWVSANAGSGKTHVLTQRVIRLLLAGARPSSILCLTYTKAAASEMSNRVFDRLAEWATLSDQDLAGRIEAIERRPPDRIKIAEARRLFARALETPGGLKIQTIHAFCEALLHQFPLEANVAGHFSVLDDRAASVLLADARRSLLTATAAEDDAALAEAFAEVLSLGDEFGLENLLSDIVSNRHAVRGFLAKARHHGGVDPALRAALGVTPEETAQSLAEAFWPLPSLEGPQLSTYIDLALSKGGVLVQGVALKLEAAVRQPDALLRVGLLEEAFFTAADKPKADRSLIAAAMAKAAPYLSDAIFAARDHVVACRERLRLYRLFTATRAALTLAERLDHDYEELKKRSSQLDFEDLIARTAELLTRSTVGPWVHYKLDQGIDHILVDEAQDTSPVQWSVIRSLREDFFSGQSARPVRRTFFAVGDEKQSIYSFQGARPERFSEEARETAQEVARGGEAFSAIRLPLSFRSTHAVLSAVDQVFSKPDNARGLSATSEAVVHMSSRSGHPGTVEVWEMIAPEGVDNEEDWTAPFDATPESAPSAILARRIAQRIEAMIGRETIVEKGVERAIEAGDILILVRKRGAFVNALTRALKRRSHIPVAGADRLRLTGHIAVQDLLALGRFVLFSADDLSLAALLKSPLFDLGEDHVFEVAARRGDLSVYAEIARLAEEGSALWQAILNRLQRYQTLAHTLLPHDFYARVLGPLGGRRDFLARLGSEVSDILDEFLTFTLSHEQAGLPGLQSFITTLEQESPEVKREQDKERSEVRIMTVHASKGLEAPVVFLVDDGAKAFNHTHLPKFRMIETGQKIGECPIWAPVKAVDTALTAEDVARRRQATEEEYRRLLYVGMTRAADRLVVCGYRGKQQQPEIWHEMVWSALKDDGERCREERFKGSDGEWQGLLWQMEAGPERFRRQEQQTHEKSELEALPEALLRPAPPPPRLPRPLSPSGAGIEIDDEDGNLMLNSPLFGKGEDAGLALQRGRLVHRMLQMLPGLPSDEREAAARRYSERAARFWPAGAREQLVIQVLAVLDHPALTTVFSAHAQAELSLMGTMRLGGEERAVSARVDRMAVTDEKVILLDYKTNRQPPRRESDVPLSHSAQLAIYRELLTSLYPNRPIECLLVYTEGPHVVALTEVTLSHALQALQPLHQD